jgi:hypothetical protein
MSGIIEEPMGQVEAVSAADDLPKVEKPKKPRASRAKPKLPVDPDAAVVEKVSKPRKKKEALPSGEAELPKKKEATVENVKMPDVPLLVRESVEVQGDAKNQESEASQVKKRGRPTIDKFATVSARIRGGEFADDTGNKAKLAIYVSRVLAEDKAFRPPMKELLTELGHVDLISVFALR